jgi:hypothetical protein
MKRYFAYFDYLGYKQFIFNNESAQLRTRVDHILRDIEMALGQGKYQEPKNGVILSDLNTSRINCLNISDTVIFWTIDDSIDSLEELLLVAYRFNWQENMYNMPVRGVIYFDEFEMISGKSNNSVGVVYSTNIMYGKGLVNAHLKCENINWAGSVIDNTVINELNGKVDMDEFLKPFASLYKVPYKKEYEGLNEEYALNLLSDTLNDTAYENAKKDILRAFSIDNKSVEGARVQELITNTILFLDTFREIQK